MCKIFVRQLLLLIWYQDQIYLSLLYGLQNLCWPESLFLSTWILLIHIFNPSVCVNKTEFPQLVVCQGLIVWEVPEWWFPHREAMPYKCMQGRQQGEGWEHSVIHPILPEGKQQSEFKKCFWPMVGGWYLVPSHARKFFALGIFHVCCSEALACLEFLLRFNSSCNSKM